MALSQHLPDNDVYPHILVIFHVDNYSGEHLLVLVLKDQGDSCSTTPPLPHCCVIILFGQNVARLRVLAVLRVNNSD
jgi:hypothetical protein